MKQEEEVISQVICCGGIICTSLWTDNHLLCSPYGI